MEGRTDKLPLLSTPAGPKDPNWTDRLKEEYLALIEYIKQNKAEDNDWFKIESNKEGTKWTGKCWVIHELAKYEFKLEFEVREG